MSPDTNDYTLICHKPDGADMCRGCVMDRWSGEFDICASIDAMAVVRYIVNHLKKARDRREPDWTFVLVTTVGGKLVTWEDLMGGYSASFATSPFDLDTEYPELVKQVAAIQAAIRVAFPS